MVFRGGMVQCKQAWECQRPMTKKAGGNKAKERRAWPDYRLLWKALYQRGIIGVLLIALAVVTFLALVGLSGGGHVLEWWGRLLRQGFGWGSYVVATLVAGGGTVLLIGKAPAFRRVPWHVVTGAEIIFLALLSLTHLAFGGSDPWQSARAGEGGGYIGAVLGGLLGEVLGPVTAGLAWGLVLMWGAITASGLTVGDWAEQAESWAYGLWRRVRVAWARISARQTAPIEALPPAQQTQDNMLDPATPELAAPEPEPSQPAGRVVAPLRPAVTIAAGARQRPARRYKIELPPLKLLDMPSTAAVDETELKEKSDVIEQTLSQFGIPAKVVEVNRGPMVTQFGVEPGYVTQRGSDGEETERKIRVAKIAALNKDLALALAATLIRIEAPVPGRSIVGIEVPNREVSVVPLRRVMSSPAFRRKASLKLALGEGTAGAPVVADLAKMPHLLIAGATGSGKSVCINAIATCLLLQHSPLTLRMVMVDPKRVELSRYQGLPHLYGGVESDAERVGVVLRWLVQEMQERYKKLAQVSARHIDDYNRHWRVGSREYLPRIVVLIDELADLMLFAPDATERSICRLAQMARATGMHVVIATQRPSVDVVTGLIKANFPARIGFAVSSGMDSRVILDAVGAETLLSKGDMLYMAPDASRLVRAQGSLVSDDEMQRVIGYWQAWATAEGWEQEPCPWDAVLEQEGEADGDELLRRAIDIVREQGFASASMLQRRMRVGYPRASRLIDEMEERGIVGPAERGGRPRQILDPDPEAVSKT